MEVSSSQYDFYQAIQQGDLEKFKALYEEGVFPTDQIFNPLISRSPLFVAAQFGHLPVIKYLIEEGFSPMVELSDGPFIGQTPLSIARKQGHRSVSDYLSTVQMNHAAMRGDLMEVQMLASIGVSLSNPIGEGLKKGETPLFVAAQFGCLKIVMYIVSRGVSIDQPIHEGIHQGETPYFIALKHSRRHVVRYFQQQGAILSVELTAKLLDDSTAPSIHLDRQVYASDQLLPKRSTIFLGRKKSTINRPHIGFFECIMDGSDDASTQKEGSKKHVLDDFLQCIS